MVYFISSFRGAEYLVQSLNIFLNFFFSDGFIRKSTSSESTCGACTCTLSLMQYYFEFHYCSNSRVETKRCHVDNGSSKYSVL